MKPYPHYQRIGNQKIAELEAHLALYHGSVFDVPRYVVIFWYCLLYLIAPAPKRRLTKDEACHD